MNSIDQDFIGKELDISKLHVRIRGIEFSVLKSVIILDIKITKDEFVIITNKGILSIDRLYLHNEDMKFKYVQDFINHYPGLWRENCELASYLYKKENYEN